MESAPIQEPSENDTGPSRSQSPRRTTAQGTVMPTNENISEETYDLYVIKDVNGLCAWVRFFVFRVLPYLIIISAFIYTLLVSKTARPAIPAPNQSANKIQLFAALGVFLASLVLQPLTNRMWNSLRWKLGTKDSGIPYLSFLVLGPSTTTWGLVRVLMGDIYSKLQRRYFRKVRDSGIQTPGQIPGRSRRQQVRVRPLRIVIKAFNHTKKWLTSYPGLAFLR